MKKLLPLCLGLCTFALLGCDSSSKSSGDSSKFSGAPTQGGVVPGKEGDSPEFNVPLPSGAPPEAQKMMNDQMKASRDMMKGDGRAGAPKSTGQGGGQP